VERLPGPEIAGTRKAPDDPLRARIDDHDPVVVAVGDHHVAGHRARRERPQAEALRRRQR